MTNAQIIKEITHLPLSEKIQIIELILRDIRQESEREKNHSETDFSDYPTSENSLSQGKSEKKGKSIKELFGSVSLGNPTGADNESIDADLAREYGATHDK